VGGRIGVQLQVLSSTKRRPRLSRTGAACCCRERQSRWSRGGAAPARPRGHLGDRGSRVGIVSGQVLSSAKRQSRLSGTGAACCCRERQSGWSGGGAAPARPSGHFGGRGSKVGIVSGSSAGTRS
jgi:hypothetical protein